jgi:hypothetical protein
LAGPGAGSSGFGQARFGGGDGGIVTPELASRLIGNISGYASACVVKSRLPAGRGCTACLRLGAALCGGGGSNAGTAKLLLLRGGGGGGTMPSSFVYMISPVTM